MSTFVKVFSSPVLKPLVKNLKISIITVVYNGEKHIAECINSVLSQSYQNLEYIIVDGGSVDSTISVINSFDLNRFKLIQGPDQGVYDAINKGIALATGDIIGLLHADDYFPDEHVLDEIVTGFLNKKVDIVYGDLEYIDAQNKQVIRRWKSSPFHRRKLEFGWMPAHPTMYMRREVFLKEGLYSLEFGTAGDYEFILRIMSKDIYCSIYLPKLFVKMRVGGMSNRSFASRWHAFVNDYKAAQLHGMKFPFITILMKKVGKIFQYF